MRFSSRLPLILVLFISSFFGGMFTIETQAIAAHSRSKDPVEALETKIHPGETEASKLKDLLGKPYRVLREGASREYYFYDFGDNSGLDATVCLRKGVVEYFTYLCAESLSDVEKKYSRDPAFTRKIRSSGLGRRGHVLQRVYESRGRAFLFEPRTNKIKACVAWEPGKKFDEIGR